MTLGLLAECDNSRSEAICRLLERALATGPVTKPRWPAPDENSRIAGRSIKEARVALERALAAIGRAEANSTSGLADEAGTENPRRTATPKNQLPQLVLRRHRERHERRRRIMVAVLDVLTALALLAIPALVLKNILY